VPSFFSRRSLESSTNGVDQKRKSCITKNEWASRLSEDKTLLCSCSLPHW
jgi:hypothetical protein